MPEPLILHIVQALKQHFLYPYKTVNASRLPVIAIHSIYATLLPEANLHQDRKLAPLNSLKGIGDIEIFDGESRHYEAIAIKPRPITLNIVNAIPKKIKGKQVIIDGVLPLLTYSLRLVDDLNAYLDTYTLTLQKEFDRSNGIKTEHLQVWAELRKNL
ncbi:MAG: hypothetical protein HZC38_08710 [Chloroflexi bacterium]|nr:hypothetical protein [Chloroflexota bacterium]